MGQIFGRPPCRGDLTIAGATSELHTAIAFQTALASRSHRPTSDAERGNIVTPAARFSFFFFFREYYHRIGRRVFAFLSLSSFFFFFFLVFWSAKQGPSSVCMHGCTYVSVRAHESLFIEINP